MPQIRRVFDIAAAIVIVAGITMLVRPGSHGPALVTALGVAFTNAATGAIGTPASVANRDAATTTLVAATTSSPAPAAVTGPTAAGTGTIGGTYNPSSYDTPGGLVAGSFW